MEFWNEYWNGESFPFQNLPQPRVKPESPTLQVNSLLSESPYRPPKKGKQGYPEQGIQDDDFLIWEAGMG